MAATITAGHDTDRTVALVEKARGGDREAYGDLVEIYWVDLVALARGILASDTEAEDRVQESLVQAWSRLWMLRKPESFAAWLRRIVARRTLSWARRQRPSGAPELEPAVQIDPGAPIDVRELLGRLSARQRAALYLTWIEGCTDREAARTLGMRPATVRVHRFRGMENLRRMVKETR